jgi:integrase
MYHLHVWSKKQEHTPGTIEKSFTVMITVLYYYWDIKDEKKIEMTDKFQSKNFKRGEKSKNKPNPITGEQLMALNNHTFKEKSKETVKKMILLQCYTGIRFDDIKRIRPEHIQNNFLVFTPKKTKGHNVEVEQPLNSHSKALLEEVEYDTSCYKLTNQAYNREIKELLKLLSAKEEYKDLKFKTEHTSHNFRDTFISLAVTKGVNWKSILKWVGQSSYSIMDRYIHLTKPFEECEMKKMFI